MTESNAILSTSVVRAVTDFLSNPDHSEQPSGSSGRHASDQKGMTLADRLPGDLSSSLVDAVHQFGTPAYVYIMPRLRSRIQDICSAFSHLDAKIFFFESANRSPVVLGAMSEADIGLSIVRPAGALRAISEGFRVNQVECSGFGFSEEDLRFVVDRGIFVNLASPPELEIFRRMYPHQEFGVRVALYEDPKDKRGFPGRTLMDYAKDSDFNMTSIHTYVGTNIRSVQDQLQSARELFRFAADLPKPVRASLSAVNLGGGFGYDYSQGIHFDWSYYGHGIKKLLEQYQSRFKKPIQVKFEIGRSLVVDSAFFVVKILHAYRKDQRAFLVVNSNVSHFPRPVRYGFDIEHYPFMDSGNHQALVLDDKGERQFLKIGEAGEAVAIVGNSHYSKDWLGFVRLNEFKPNKLIGRYIAFLDAGAYCESMMDSWTDEPDPATIAIDGEDAKLVSSRSTLGSKQ